MDFEHLKFFGQSIVHSNTEKVDSYELLLRSNGTNGNFFPKDDYVECIANKEIHKAYMKWLEKVLQAIFRKNPQVKYSLNFDHQELEYEETFELLEHLAKHTDQLTIEITEVPAVQRTGSYFSPLNVEAFKRISDLGFLIAIDGVGQGINSIGNMLQVQDYIYRIKFSILHFKNKVSEANLKQIIVLLGDICHDLGKEFVVEGIEEKGMAEWLEEHCSSLQQGYLYSKPQNIWPITY